MKPILPRKPSALIRLALSDLEKVQKLKTRKIDMNWWHEPYKGKCVVCLAGSVMDRTFKADPRLSSVPYEVVKTDEDRDALEALNQFRLGICSFGFGSLNIDPKLGFQFSREIPEFTGKGTKFKKAMRELANDLEKGGY